ncbi:ATP synthase F1 subcomplex epsilon subunit [Stella humosa]|uniref:ATP synthase epsilon chain n=1 Tax=Stella humosa TaxID=94 RepID=A0A3N1KZM0_9PROT|nr:ATP synthase F1 subcomplex epsilon subunit [Stella humosa]BBK34147.1 ATP synthase epsilon chain [Stella humosa]
MAETIAFELVSPERLLFARPVEMVVVPGVEGDFGVLPRHAPLIAVVRPGVIAIFEGGKVAEQIFVAGGFAEVTAERCTVLAERAVPVAEIDRAVVERKLKDDREAADTAEIEIGEAMLAALDNPSYH